MNRHFQRIPALVLTFFLVNLTLTARTFMQFSHYSIKEGLSDINVLCMLQDSKGQMWFGTFDGLNKMDGYSFRTYKTNPGQRTGLENYRIDRLQEDGDGYLWIQTYDRNVFRFDPSSETFLKIPQCDERFSNFNIRFSQLVVLPDRSVWLTSEEDGCFRIRSDEKGRPGIVQFDKINQSLPSDRVNKVFMDSRQNTWILTAGGVALLKPKAQVPQKLFCDKERSDFLSIAENNGRIWLGGKHGKIRSYDLRRGSSDGMTLTGSSDVIDIKRISDRELFLLTDHSGFIILDPLTLRQTLYNTTTFPGILTGNLYSCQSDRRGDLWMETDGSMILRYDSRLHRVFRYVVPTQRTLDLVPTHKFLFDEDLRGTIWIQPRQGSFCRFDPTGNTLQPFLNNPDLPGQRYSGKMHSAFSDRQGNLWLCPNAQGIEKVVFTESPFTFTKPDAEGYHSAANEVRSVLQDPEGMFWVGNKREELVLYGPDWKKIGLLGSDGRIGSGSPLHVSAYCMTRDKSGHLWIGTKGKGVYRLTQKAGTKDRYEIEHYGYDGDDIYSLSSDIVYSVFQDHRGRIWLGTYGGGLNLLDESDGKVRFFNARNRLKNFPIEDCNKVRYLTEDSRHYLLIGTTSGLVVSKTDNGIPENQVFRRYHHESDNTHSLRGNDIYSILPARDGTLYLAIFGGGLNRLDPGYEWNDNLTFKALQVGEGLPSNTLFSMRQDRENNLWLTTQTNLVRYRPANATFDSFDPQGEKAFVFEEAAVCTSRRGELVFGTSEGCLHFIPQEAVKSPFVPSIVLTQLLIFNKEVMVGVTDSPLDKTLDAMDKVELNHTQNIFSICYAAEDHTFPQNIRYAYKLEGFEKDWNQVKDQRIATYSNLPKGKYVFRVRSTNADGVWVNNERSIVIERKPSFWESTWGILFYVLLFVGLSYLTYRILYSFLRLRSNVELEHRLTNLKVGFFTDISHELRTPLTLISSPVEHVLRTETLSESARVQLGLVQRNTGRMLRLINQLLDFQKIQSKKMTLTIELIRPGPFVREVAENFRTMANERNIPFTVSDLSNQTAIWADKDKLEKILYNLLSNAFKFTPPGKPVDVWVKEEEKTVSVTVSDAGTGMSREQMNRLFHPFESFAGSISAERQSTGIGLSLTKELVELHHGTISVESQPNQGSSFTVTFLKGKDHFMDEEVHADRSDATLPASAADHSRKILEDPERTFIARKTILVVEDHAELRDFLRSILIGKFNMLEAGDGLAGLELARTELPDIILSDIMMPGLDGMELAKAVKQDKRIRHIPIILLTAKTDLQNKLDALDEGVDDYITKPFSSAYLEARIDNLLHQRNNLQESIRSSLSTSLIRLSMPEVDSRDEAFLKKVVGFIEDNIENKELTIDEIADHAAYGRSTFFKKVKTLTGLSPIEFLREVRIQRAARLIESGDFYFNEICMMVGINDPHYFSRCFKQKFGITPRQYKEKNQKG